MAPPEETDRARQARESRAALARFGMSEQELKVWDDLTAVAGRALHLLGQARVPLAQQREVVADIHRLQNRLLARPGLRAMGWPQARRTEATSEEAKLSIAVGAVVQRMLALPLLHPSEREEASRDAHHLQDRLLALGAPD